MVNSLSLLGWKTCGWNSNTCPNIPNMFLFLLIWDTLHNSSPVCRILFPSAFVCLWHCYSSVPLIVNPHGSKRACPSVSASPQTQLPSPLWEWLCQEVGLLLAVHPGITPGSVQGTTRGPHDGSRLTTSTLLCPMLPPPTLPLKRVLARNGPCSPVSWGLWQHSLATHPLVGVSAGAILDCQGLFPAPIPATAKFLFEFWQILLSKSELCLCPASLYIKATTDREEILQMFCMWVCRESTNCFYSQVSQN